MGSQGLLSYILEKYPEMYRILLTGELRIVWFNTKSLKLTSLTMSNKHMSKFLTSIFDTSLENIYLDLTVDIFVQFILHNIH